jgi:hypothetical protein
MGECFSYMWLQSVSQSVRPATRVVPCIRDHPSIVHMMQWRSSFEMKWNRCCCSLCSPCLQLVSRMSPNQRLTKAWSHCALAAHAPQRDPPGHSYSASDHVLLQCPTHRPSLLDARGKKAGRLIASHTALPRLMSTINHDTIGDDLYSILTRLELGSTSLAGFRTLAKSWPTHSVHVRTHCVSSPA